MAFRLTRAFTHSRTHALTHSRTHALTHSRTHALTHSRTHALTHTCSSQTILLFSVCFLGAPIVIEIKTNGKTQRLATTNIETYQQHQHLIQTHHQTLPCYGTSRRTTYAYFLIRSLCNFYYHFSERQNNRSILKSNMYTYKQHTSRFLENKLTIKC